MFIDRCAGRDAAVKKSGQAAMRMTVRSPLFLTAPGVEGRGL